MCVYIWVDFINVDIFCSTLTFKLLPLCDFSLIYHLFLVLRLFNLIGQRRQVSALIGPSACQSAGRRGHFSPTGCLRPVASWTWTWDRKHGGTSSAPDLDDSNTAAEEQCGGQTAAASHGFRGRWVFVIYNGGNEELWERGTGPQTTHHCHSLSVW